MSWNITSAVQHLDSHAGSESLGRCAEFTSRAIGAGGLSITGRESAKDFGPSLLAAGFHEVPSDGLYKKGDVVVIQGIPGHLHGHMAMFDGDQWVSDFKQRSLYPGEGYRHAMPSYVVYRHD